MNVDCHWIEDKLEAFFCERLSAEETQAANSHLESCEKCRGNVEEIRNLGPLVQQVFRQNLAMARLPPQRRSPVAIGAFATTAVALLLLVVWAIPRQSNTVQNTKLFSSAAGSAATTDTPSIPKVEQGSPEDRAKPQPQPSADQPSSGSPGSIATDGTAKDFLITDSAGYSRTLADYRGYILIFGMWSEDQPRTVSNLQRIYDSFGSNTKLRIVGVSTARKRKPANATFQVAYNQGSTLFGASVGQFLILDATGSIRFRGSLLDSPVNVVNSVQATLQTLAMK